MNENLTELVFILDKSGSMHGMEEDTIGGYNSTIEKERDKEGDALVSAVLFSNSSYVLHDRIPIRAVPAMTERDYTVGGCTALLDAIGDAIHHIGNVHKYARDEDRPAHTLFVIITDGMENASHRYSSDEIKHTIEKQKKEYGWDFLFLGANIDAVETAKHYGIDEDSAATYKNDRVGANVMYGAVQNFVRASRAQMPREGWKAQVDEDVARRGR